MCRSCNGVTNVHDRIANHDFVEQMRDYYGLDSKPIKDRKKTTKKSVLARIEHQLLQLQSRTQEKGYSAVHARLSELLIVPYTEEIADAFDSIMDDYSALLKAEILAHLKE